MTFLKWWYPQIIHFNRVFQYKLSILGYPYFWKHPNIISMLTDDVGDFRVRIFLSIRMKIQCPGFLDEFGGCYFGL